MKWMICWLVWVVGLSTLLAAESYHKIQVADLKMIDAEGLEEILEHRMSVPRRAVPVAVRCPVECYFAIDPIERQGGMDRRQRDVNLVFRLKDNEPVRGFIDLRVSSQWGERNKLKPFQFEFTPSEKTLTDQKEFELMRAHYAAWCSQRHSPGVAWFRHLAKGAPNTPLPMAGRRSDIQASFELFSGGRAISENLALDREVILASEKEGDLVPLTEIQGVTVDAIDWSNRVPAQRIAVDALSLVVPEDQHAFFAQNAVTLLDLIGRLENEVLPASQNFSVRSPYTQIISRYQKQMGLDVGAPVVRFLPIKTVAVTGGDPFFPMGTDVAVLIESDAPDMLYKALIKVIAKKAARAGALPVRLQVDDDYAGFENRNRSFSSYVWKMGDVIGVSNSRIQLKRLMAVHKGKAPALGETDEYRYFRHRYQIGEEETAFAFLSDATIRRWAGPELRIAASRRTRALAAMGELTSKAIAGEPLGEDYVPLLGKVDVVDGQVVSANYGTTQFMTPSLELGIEAVTPDEKAGYDQWRTGYERGWSQVFDPIAVRLVNDKEGMDVDLSVIPLRADTDFRQFIRFCGEARLSERARWVPEESALHVALAIDTKSDEFKDMEQMALSVLPGLKLNPLAWMDGSISVDLFGGLFWEAGNVSEMDLFMHTPAVLRVGSNSRIKLALFMTAVKASIEKSSPNSIKWEVRERGGESYVVLQSKEDESETGEVCYATMPNALLVSFREDLLLEAMRRERHKLTEADRALLPKPTQTMLETSPKFMLNLERMVDRSSQVSRVQLESWKAIPILNEWHQLYPQLDPVAVHSQRYGVDLACPGGQGYRWNPTEMTMESVAYGFPAKPRDEPAIGRSVLDYECVRTGLSFENDGLRAQLHAGDALETVPTPEEVKPDLKPLGTAADITPLKEGWKMIYKGESHGEKATMTYHYKNIVKKDGKVNFDIQLGWETPDMGQMTETYQYLLDGSLYHLSIRSEDGWAKYDSPVIEMPGKLVAGKVVKQRYTGSSSWKYDGDETKDQFTAEASLRVIGSETIEVPAGTFEDCVKILYTFEIIGSDYYDYNQLLNWYHPKVGLVKYESIRGPKDVMELHSIEEPK